MIVSFSLFMNKSTGIPEILLLFKYLGQKIYINAKLIKSTIQLILINFNFRTVIYKSNISVLNSHFSAW